MHSEDGLPADHGAPEGNDNARGHRAPHVALNGFKHGADAKLSTLLLSMGMLRVRHRPTGDRLLVAPDGPPDSTTAWQVVVNQSRPERSDLDHVEMDHIELLDYAPHRLPRRDEKAYPAGRDHVSRTADERVERFVSGWTDGPGPLA